MRSKECNINTSAISSVIKYYTREAGVRNLEREIAKMCRKATTNIVKGITKKVAINSKNINEFLGVKKFRHGETERKNLIRNN